MTTQPQPQPKPETSGEQSVYAAVLFAGNDRSSVAEVAILFESAAAADEYALGCRWDDYLVGTVRFHLPPRTCRVRWTA